MELKKYVNEIIDLAEANNMSWDVGKDMFIANIQNHGIENAPYYAGAGDFDYGAIRDEWVALTPEQKRDAKNAFDDWYRANMERTEGC